VSISSVVVVDDAGVIKSDMKSCPTFAISVTSLRKFCKSTNLPNPTRTQTKQFWFGSAKIWVLVPFVQFESHL